MRSVFYRNPEASAVYNFRLIQRQNGRPTEYLLTPSKALLALSCVNVTSLQSVFDLEVPCLLHYPGNQNPTRRNIGNSFHIHRHLSRLPTCQNSYYTRYRGCSGRLRFVSRSSHGEKTIPCFHLEPSPTILTTYPSVRPRLSCI